MAGVSIGVWLAYLVWEHNSKRLFVPRSDYTTVGGVILLATGTRRILPTTHSTRGFGMPGKFVIKKGRTGQFRFSLVGRNGQIVATSETYTTKASCLNGVKAVKTLAADAGIEDQTTKTWGD